MCNQMMYRLSQSLISVLKSLNVKGLQFLLHYHVLFVLYTMHIFLYSSFLSIMLTELGHILCLQFYLSTSLYIGSLLLDIN